MNWFVAVVFVASVLAAQVDAGGENVYCRYEAKYVYGTEKRPGKSCKNIKDHIRDGSLSNGIYWISLIKGSYRWKHQQKFPVFCDMRSGGWTMVFKTVSGGARTRIGEWWRQKHPASEFTTAALNTNNHFRGVYKNRIVNNVNWGKFATEVRMVLYKHGVEQLVLRFNAKGTDILNWFTRTRLLQAPWYDITHTHFNFFTIIGPCWHGECRDFHINHSYHGCPKDIGWLTLGNTKGCRWENRFHGNSFLYSKIGTRVNWNTYDKISKYRCRCRRCKQKAIKYFRYLKLYETEFNISIEDLSEQYERRVFA